MTTIWFKILAFIGCGTGLNLVLAGYSFYKEAFVSLFIDKEYLFVLPFVVIGLLCNGLGLFLFIVSWSYL